jgi:hypothetical protein
VIACLAKKERSGMPDKGGKLSKGEMEAAIAWLSEREATGACPVCQYAQWSVVDQLVVAPAFGANEMLTRAGFPAVLVMCGRCSYFRLHSAVLMGFVVKQSVEGTKDGQ